jgi:spermidine synthase
MIKNKKWPVLVIVLLFFASGCTALIYQTVLNKFFSFVFGVSSYATATVLAAFMLGLAAGSYLFGKLATQKITRHWLWYGILEFFIGSYGLILIPLAGLIEDIFVSLAQSYTLSLQTLTLLRFVMALVMIGIPTTLMGGSLPLLLEGMKRRGISRQVNLLYGINILGGAFGTVFSSYFLIARVFLDGALRTVFAANAIILLMAVILETGLARKHFTLTEVDEAAPMAALRSRLPMYIVAIGFFSGYLSFSNEVLWNHLLSLIIGTSTYAYAVMLFTTLIGMGLGGLIVHRALQYRNNHRQMIGISQLLLGGSIILTLPLIDKIPPFFAFIGTFLDSFGSRELVRFLGCMLLIFIPSLISGLTFPLVLSYLEKNSRHLGESIGRIYSINAIGTVLGSLISGFVVLQWLGGRNALMFSAAVSLLLGASIISDKLKTVIGTAVASGLFFALAFWISPTWDLKSLLSASNIYFSEAHTEFDELVYQHEDNTGGITSVIRKGQTLTMLTNGKFQGNNGSEVIDQERFALIPNLFVHSPRRALNIGLGTGTTLGVIAQFPYKEIEVAELARDIVYAADTYFSDVNRNALHDPRVRVYLEDGRNYLALNRKDHLFDLISIELTSIWFAGAGNLYNDEFYKLAVRNMSADGILQQWIQLHHMTIEDIAIILRTIKKNFKYVQLWVPQRQGVIIASNQPLTLMSKRMDELKQGFPAKHFMVEEPWTILGELLLTNDQIDRFLEKYRRQDQEALSTDLNLHLEYSTPKGNALGWNFTENFSLLQAFTDGDIRSILPDLLHKDPYILSMTELGRTHFYPEYSTNWHQQIERALSLIPAKEKRLALKQRVYREMQERKTRLPDLSLTDE